MKVYYWSPFISKIATIKAVLNSNIALNKFSNRQIDAYVINSFGEFSENSYRYRGSYLKFKSLVKKNYIKFFSDKGFLKSRLSWILISLITVFPLIRLLKRRVGFHHGKMPDKIRELVEMLFKNKKIFTHIVA